MEHYKEIKIGPITWHRIFSVLFVFLLTYLFLGMYSLIFPDNTFAISYLEHFWSSGHYLWIAGAPSCFMGLVGLISYRKVSLENVRPVQNHVVFRIVSLGKNVEALTSTVDQILIKMKSQPLFSFTIEILVEDGQPFCDVDLQYPDNLVKIVVIPQDYSTENGTIKKARALQYGMENSNYSDDTWIIHLDEESRPHDTMISGIAKAIREEETNGKHRIGQGAIIYNRHWNQGKYYFWTLLDSSRTGQDLGPFYFQSKLGISLYGFHGSWILIRNSVEKSIPGGFDLGLKGSITEDAWWCLVANSNGHKIRWVEGYLEEQSVRSFRDFCKQRGRWFYGLRLVGKHTPVSWIRRLPLRMNLTLWMIVWASIPYSIIYLWFGFSISIPLLIIISLTLATYVSMVVTGMWVNVKLSKFNKWWNYILLTPLQISLVPVYALMEIYAAFVYGVCFPDKKGFYVIDK